MKRGARWPGSVAGRRRCCRCVPAGAVGGGRPLALPRPAAAASPAAGSADRRRGRGRRRWAPRCWSPPRSRLLACAIGLPAGRALGPAPVPRPPAGAVPAAGAGHRAGAGGHPGAAGLLHPLGAGRHGRRGGAGPADADGAVRRHAAGGAFADLRHRPTSARPGCSAPGRCAPCAGHPAAAAPGAGDHVLLTFLISWSEYVLTLLIGGGRVTTLPLLLFAAIGSSDRTAAAALGLLVVLPPVLLVLAGRPVASGPRRRLAGAGPWLIERGTAPPRPVRGRRPLAAARPPASATTAGSARPGPRRRLLHRAARPLRLRQEHHAGDARRPAGRRRRATSLLDGRSLAAVPAEHRPVSWSSRSRCSSRTSPSPRTSASGCGCPGVRAARIAPRGRGHAGAGPARRARRPPRRTSSPAARSSGSRWPGRWCCGPGCCCSTSRSPSSTPSCASRCGGWCASCTTSPA